MQPAFSEEAYPSLLKIEIGTNFPHPQALLNKDTNRPTTQYQVPNYGEVVSIFSEYEIATLNTSNHIVIVSAKKTLKDYNSCNSYISQLKEMLKIKYPNYQEQENKYSAPNNNIYYTLQCQQSYGPFWTLSLQFRGEKEDLALKKAWEDYFKKQ